MTGLGNFKYLHCMVDSATRMGDVLPLKAVKGAGVVRALEQWQRRHGKIAVLVTDNASYYASRVVKRRCEAQGICHRFIAPYRHQSVGIIERFQRTFVDRLRKLKYALGGSWTKHVPLALEAMNFGKHSTTGKAPVELWTASEEELQLAQERTRKMRAGRNKRRRVRPTTFYPGQSVLVYDEIAAQNRGDKFAPVWKGPYRLVKESQGSYWKVQRMGNGDAIMTEPGRRPKMVFHEDQLQPFDKAYQWTGKEYSQ